MPAAAYPPFHAHCAHCTLCTLWVCTLWVCTLWVCTLEWENGRVWEWESGKVGSKVRAEQGRAQGRAGTKECVVRGTVPAWKLF